ncbi:hypothetical protein B0O80DRAFT_429877 [Mortierella sp. GBAus27b]|nr:hypothetical protein BGX31_004107 [Mortierella sp. GBA43]KAI8347886.1 hypothetical protein B0O80DRAFT_429877 [Mortierella sp. GBAus27b]
MDHRGYQQDSYAMDGSHSAKPLPQVPDHYDPEAPPTYPQYPQYPQYQQHPHDSYGDKESISSNHDVNSTTQANQVTHIKAERSSCNWLPCFPCIKSTCGRITCCIFMVLLLVVIILVIVAFTVFKKPTVQYLGVDGMPKFTLNQGYTTLGIDFFANVQVNNPNPVGIDIDSITSTAYFPGYGPSIGGGNLTHVNFPSKSTTIIKVPVSIQYDRRQDPDYQVIKTILSKCGVLGKTDGRFNITYDAKATTKILGISVTIEQKGETVFFDCPVNISDIMGGIPASIIQGITKLFG